MAPCLQRGCPLLRPLKWYASLSGAKERKKEGFFLIEGKRAVDQVTASPAPVEEILATGNSLVPAGYSGTVRLLTPAQFRSISSAGTPQGVAALVKIPEDVYTEELPENTGKKILVLENIQDPGNTGTLIRTAAALDYSGVILSEGTADPFSPKAVQSTAGALFAVWVRRTGSYLQLMQTLKKRGYRIFTADSDGVPVGKVTMTLKHVLVLGNEGVGLTNDIREIADMCVAVPINGSSVESLNVASAGAILMYELGVKNHR